MSEPVVAFCSRCDHEVAVEHRYPRRLRRALEAYLYVPIALIPLFPFLAGDFMVSLPMMMLYMLGLGPAMTIIKDPATCVRCGALTTAVAPVRNGVG